MPAKKGQTWEWSRECPPRSDSKAYHAWWRNKNKEKLREYFRIYTREARLKKPGKQASYQKQRRLKNPEKILNLNRKYYRERREEFCEKSRKWSKNNREKINAYRRDRFSNDANFREALRLRDRIRSAVRRSRLPKLAKTESLIGCSIQHLKDHLISLFTDGMTWELLMSGAIHIDHKTPCSKFDLTKKDQQLLCCHYTNLQPLWAEDNWRKGDKVA